MSDQVSPTSEPLESERGATMLEYGFLITLVGLAVAVALGPLGAATAAMFDDVRTFLP